MLLKYSATIFFFVSVCVHLLFPELSQGSCHGANFKHQSFNIARSFVEESFFGYVSTFRLS